MIVCWENYWLFVLYQTRKLFDAQFVKIFHYLTHLPDSVSSCIFVSESPMSPMFTIVTLKLHCDTHCWTESCFSEWEVVVGIFQQRKQTGGNQLIITLLPKQKYFTIWDNEKYFRKISVKLFHHNFYKFSSRNQGI